MINAMAMAAGIYLGWWLVSQFNQWLLNRPVYPGRAPTGGASSMKEYPSDTSLMSRALLIAERLNHTHNGSDVQFVFEQLKLVRMYTNASGRAAAEARAPEESMRCRGRIHTPPRSPTLDRPTR